MKKHFVSIMAILAAVVLLMFMVYITGAQGAESIITLYDSKPTVTTSITGTARAFPSLVQTFTCEATTNPTTTLTYYINAKAHPETVVFQTTPIISSTTTTYQISTTTVVDKPTRVLQPVFSTPSTTASTVTIRCTGAGL